MNQIDIVIGKIGWRKSLPIEIKQEYCKLKGITYNIYEEVYAKRDNDKNDVVAIIGFKKYPIGLYNTKDINGIEVFGDLGDFIELTNPDLQPLITDEHLAEIEKFFDSIANNDHALIQAIKNVEFKDKDTEYAIVEIVSIQDGLLDRYEIYHRDGKEVLAESHLECFLETVTEEDGTVSKHTKLVNTGYPLLLIDMIEEKNDDGIV